MNIVLRKKPNGNTSFTNLIGLHHLRFSLRGGFFGRVREEMFDINVLLCVFKFWRKRLYVVLANSRVVIIFKSLCKVV
jgi:hypothetical protein